MKKTLIALLALAGVAGAEVDGSNTLLFAFGTNAGEGVTTKQGSFLEQSGLTYNIISTGGNNGWTTNSTLKNADGSDATGFSFNTGVAVSGSAGQVNTITNATAVDRIFDSGVMNAVINKDNGFTFTLNGLTAGTTYTMYVFAGRGNDYGGTNKTDTNTYALSSGATNITASILDYTLTTTDYPTPSLNGSSITAYTQSNDGANQTCENWILMAYDFTATANSVSLNAGGAGCGSIGAVALVAAPEPTTATLSLLALAGLAARRRRK